MTTRSANRPTTLIAIIALIAGVIVVAPTMASAQAGGTDQYNGAVGPAGGSAEGPGDEAGAAALGVEDGTAESGGGGLPFTGYPVTPLVIVFLLLLVAGVAFRVFSSRRNGIAAHAEA